MVDDDYLAINIFFSDERREEKVESILAKIKAYEDYEQSIKNKKLDISDEEFVRMALGNVPDMDKAIDSQKGIIKIRTGKFFCLSGSSDSASGPSDKNMTFMVLFLSDKRGESNREDCNQI